MAQHRSRVLPALAGTAAAACPVPVVAAPYLSESPDPYLVTAPTALAAPARSQLCSGPLTTLLRPGPLTTLLRPGPQRVSRTENFMIVASFGRYLPRTGHDHEGVCMQHGLMKRLDAGHLPLGHQDNPPGTGEYLERMGG